MACAYQATVGGKFAPLISLKDDDMDIDTMLNTYNITLTETQPVKYLGKNIVGKILGSPKTFLTSVMRGEIEEEAV